MQPEDDQQTKKRNRLFSGVMSAATLFLSVVLARNAVTQFMLGRYVGGSISTLGTILCVTITLMIFHDFHKRSGKKK